MPTPSKESYDIYKAFRDKAREEDSLKKVPAYMRSFYREKTDQELMYESHGSNFSINPEVPLDGDTPSLAAIKRKLADHNPKASKSSCTNQ